MPRADAALVRQGTDAAIRSILAARRDDLARISPSSAALADALLAFCAGGKMLRPRFCALGAEAISPLDEARERELFQLGAAIELVQAAALIHDDVIDHSEVRRGRPAVHVAAALEHEEKGMSGASEDHGIATAIILGDLALAWARSAAQSAAEPSPHRLSIMAEFDALCTEVMAGQHLDILNQAGGYDHGSPVQEALDVIRWKTVPYTVLRPVRMGAQAAGASDDQLDGLSRWAVDVGTAFQLRDDLLGVLGEEAATGKPRGGDIIEGKRTVILAEALAAAGPEDRPLLESVMGGEAGAMDIDGVVRAMRRTGAIDAAASRIRALHADSAAVLASIDLTPDGRAGLAQIADEASELASLGLA